MKKTKKKLLEILKDKIPDRLLKLIPSRYPILGSAILVRLNTKLLDYSRIIGETLLKILPNILILLITLNRYPKAFYFLFPNYISLSLPGGHFRPSALLVLDV